jgi:Zn-dependent protease with chaperone function
MNEKNIRLNPFVYISETGVRFYLMVLIGIIMPSLWALIFGIVIFSVMAGAEITLFLRLLIVIPIFSFIPFLIYWDYKRSPKKIIKESKLKEFDKEKYPEHHECIEQLHEEFLSAEKKPALMVQPLDPSRSAFTFGTKNHIYIGIPGGLIKMFRENINGFKSIFLHEMGHIVNRDTEKTYQANSTWRSLFLTLSIPLGIFLLYDIYLLLSIFYAGISGVLDMDYIISNMNFGQMWAVYVGIPLYFIIFLGIIYVLRNQIIRLREFYADAKVFEWEKSPEKIVKTLEESGGEQYSKFELLIKFHPNINERIQVLKNNLSLFNPSLWVAFSIGFFFGLIELIIPNLYQIFSMSSSAMANQNYQSTGETYLGLRVLISILVFPILMLAVSSSFHKSILRDIFINNKKYFTFATVLNLIKFSLVFSLGWLTYTLISLPTVFSLYEINILMRDLLDMADAWLKHAFDFSIVLLYVVIFSSLLIRRSFNEKDAWKNFILVSVLSSVLYIVNRYYFVETLHNRSLLIVFSLIFSFLTYTFIKMKDKKLVCPGCSQKIDVSVSRLNCPNCQQDLYPWAIYSFS